MSSSKRSVTRDAEVEDDDDDDIQIIATALAIHDVDQIADYDLEGGKLKRRRPTEYAKYKSEPGFSGSRPSPTIFWREEEAGRPRKRKRGHLPSHATSSASTSTTPGPSTYTIEDDGIELIDPHSEEEKQRRRRKKKEERKRRDEEDRLRQDAEQERVEQERERERQERAQEEARLEAEYEQEHDEWIETHYESLPEYAFKPIPLSASNTLGTLNPPEYPNDCPSSTPYRRRIRSKAHMFYNYRFISELPPFRPPCPTPIFSPQTIPFARRHAQSLGRPNLSKYTRTQLCNGAGAINRILQREGALLIATSVSNGGEEHDNVSDSENPYNKTGSLKIYVPDCNKAWPLKEVETKAEWNERKAKGLPPAFNNKYIDEHLSEPRIGYRRQNEFGAFEYCYERSSEYEAVKKDAQASRRAHRRSRTLPGPLEWQEHHYVKLYTVNSVAYDTLNDIVASSGMDGMIRFHPLLKDAPPLEPLEFEHNIPYELAFRPHSKGEPTMLAVGGKNIQVYCNPFAEDPEDRTGFALKLVPASSEVNVGGLWWGRQASAGYLFASTESAKGGKGLHRAIHIETRSNSYDFDTSESGDELAMSWDGANLAIVTDDDTAAGRFLQVYDITQRSNPKIRTARVSLEPFQQGMNNRQINHVSYSPDGILLAMARSDNSVHIYDSRFLRSRPLHIFSHAPSKKVETYECGVVHAEWVSTGRLGSGKLGLLSGGEDGCVRLWDPMAATPGERDNGQVVAEIDADVGRISVGDRYKRERDLIVGGADGSVTIFDNVGCYSKIVDDGS